MGLFKYAPMMSPLSLFRALILTAVVAASTGANAAAPAPGSKPAKSDKAASADDVKKISAWDAQCRAGTFDIRGVHGNDVPTYAELPLACVSLTAPASAPGLASHPRSDSPMSRRLADKIRAIRGAMSGDASGDKDLCRLFVGHQDSPPTSLELRRCRLFFAVLRQKQDSKALCSQAQEMKIADEDFGCSAAMSFVDGRSHRCAGPGVAKCQELAGLVEALRSKAPNDISASPFSKVLTSHDVRDCEPYLKQANKTFCAEVAPKEALYRRQAEMLKASVAKDAAEQERLWKLEMDKAERRKAEAAAKDAGKRKYKKGEAMQNMSADIEKRMKKIEEEGRKTEAQPIKKIETPPEMKP